MVVYSNVYYILQYLILLYSNIIGGYTASSQERSERWAGVCLDVTTAILNYAYCVLHSKNTLACCYYPSRPDAQLFDGQEEEQVNRELPEDISRRQLINNLAKHVLFSKKITTRRWWVYYMHDD